MRATLCKRLVNSYKCPLDVSSAELSDYATLLLDACANGKISNINLLNKAIAFVERGGFGTHTSKFPNTNIVMSEAAIMAHPTPVSSVGAVSSNTSLSRPHLAAGNASNIPAQRLLCAVLRLDNTVISVAHDLATHGPVFRVICATSPETVESIKSLASAIKARLTTPSKLTSAINRSEKYSSGIATIFWPVDQHASEFHLLSPVSSLAMIAELQTRQLVANLNLGQQRAIKVGGAQPQNAGLLAMDHNGFINHLLSLPPPPISRRSPVNLLPPLRSLQRLIDREGNLVRNNIPLKQAQHSTVDGIVDAIINDMLDPPHGNPVTPTLTDIIGVIDAAIKRCFVPDADYLVTFREVYSDMFLEAASRQIAEIEGII